jgi:hypothetical protein
MAQGEMPEDLGSRPPQLMPSDKCDFAAIPANPTRSASAELIIGDVGQRMRIDSDKCDWRVVTPAIQVRGPSTAVTDDLQANSTAGRLRMDSDKCDWRVRFDDRQERVFRAEVAGPEFELRGSTGPVRGELRSSKCDWSVEMTGSWPGMRTPPRLRAEMDSDKCDFALRVEVGLQSGPMYRLRAIGSDKCDFRIVELPEGFVTADEEEQQSGSDGL